MHFTGQDHDWYTGLDHFPARQYAAAWGRWLTPDPSGLAAVNPSDPQSWNRYAYVENRPLMATDPMGELGCIPQGQVPANWDGCDGAMSWDMRQSYNSYSAWASDIFAYGANHEINGEIYWLDWGVGQNPFWTGPDGAVSAKAAEVLGLPALPQDIKPTPGMPTTDIFTAPADPNASVDSPLAECIAESLSEVSGGSATITGYVGAVGGHDNFSATIVFSTVTAATNFINQYEQAHGIGPPERFPGAPSLHAEGITGSGAVVYVRNAHEDLGYANQFPVGTFVHAVADGFWGQLMQMYGNRIDPSGCSQ